MKLSCPYCGTGSFVPDAALQGVARELRCQQCRTEIALPRQEVEGTPTRVELFDGRYEKLGPPVASTQGFPAYDRSLRTFVTVRERSGASFAREVELAKVLTHENILTIYDHGASRGVPYLTMEFLEGASLDALLQSEAIAYERALDLMIMAGQGLEYVHLRGLAHGALEPAKLFVTSDGVLKLTDFGSAVSDEPASRRADVGALGAIAYRLFTGASPATSDQARPTAPSTLNPRVPPELDAVLLRALAPRPEDRPEDAGELCEQLMALRRKYASQAVATAPISTIRPAATAPAARSSRALWLAGAAAVAVIGGGALFMRGEDARHSVDVAPAVRSEVVATRPTPADSRASETLAAPSPSAAAVAAPAVRQAEPMAASAVTQARAEVQSGPRTLLSPARCPAGAEPVPARELQLTQPRPRAWSFAERTLPALPLDGFCMDARSVSVAAYTKCVEEGRCTPHEESCTPSSDPNAAMKCVSWAAAQQYCAARGATLPSVAQWEAYAKSPSARTNTSEWSADTFPPAVFAARCNEENPARCDGHLWRKAGRLPTMGPDGKSQLAFSWNRGAATSDTGYEYVSFRCATPAPAR